MELSTEVKWTLLVNEVACNRAARAAFIRFIELSIEDCEQLEFIVCM